MRTTTHWLSNRFIATCATTRFVLSPFVATTTASASSIPASRSTSASMPWPSTKPPRQFSPSLVSASSFSSTAVTSQPSSASWSATFDPTRPQPITNALTGSGYLRRLEYRFLFFLEDALRKCDYEHLARRLLEHVLDRRREEARL